MAAKLAAVSRIKNKTRKRAVSAARLEWWRTKHYMAFALADDDDMTARQHTARAASRRASTGGRHGFVR
jgi:hypothetical protein